MRLRIEVMACILIIGFLAQGIAVGQSKVTLTPIDATPTQNVTVSGTGFGASEAVDVYLDTTDTVLFASSSTGTFSGILNVPAGDLPGKHFITAIGRHSGVAAQAPLTV